MVDKLIPGEVWKLDKPEDTRFFYVVRNNRILFMTPDRDLGIDIDYEDDITSRDFDDPGKVYYMMVKSSKYEMLEFLMKGGYGR